MIENALRKICFSMCGFEPKKWKSMGHRNAVSRNAARNFNVKSLWGFARINDAHAEMNPNVCKSRDILRQAQRKPGV